jgi:multidrug resistance efflux pump
VKIVRGILVLIVFAALLSVTAWLLSQWHTGSGSVSGIIELDEVHVASRYGGRVERIFAQEGDVLHAGQPIVELDAAELRARRDTAAALLAELEHGPRPAEIGAAKADWESLVAQFDFARAEDKRLQELFVEKTISETERDQAASRARALEQSAAAAKQRYELLVEGTRPERIAQARAELAEIDAQLWEMTVNAPKRSSESELPPQADRTVRPELRLPEFVLEVLSVKVGDVLTPNREVATLLLPQHLWVRVYVPELWLGRIQLGQKVSVRTDSTGKREFIGVVEQINRQAEFTPRNVQTVDDRIRQVFGVKVRLPTDTGVLRAGMSVDVFFSNVPPRPK